jgi:HSP20 family protein
MDTSVERNDKRSMVPPVRIMEDEGEVLAQLEMPGVSKDGLEIRVEGNTLTIAGRRSDETPKGRFLVRERPHEEYRKAFTIDDSVDRESISADLTDGVLTLRLGVKEAAKPRRISVS